jgi:hypothetical protein
MSEIDDILDNIESAEIEASDSISPLRLNQAYICKTSELISSTHFVSDLTSKKFAPGIILKIVVICLLALVILDRAFIFYRHDDSFGSVILPLVILLIGITQFSTILEMENATLKF